MSLSAHAALWFLPFVIPICIWVAWSDLKTMLIPNKAVLALVAVFVIGGLFLFPTWTEYLWRLSHLAILLVIGIAANAMRLMGAGDAKFIAAMAPFVNLSDFFLALMLFMASLIGCYVLHRIAQGTVLRRLAPDWKSWNTGRRFPMGFPLAVTLLAILVVAILQGTPAQLPA